MVQNWNQFCCRLNRLNISIQDHNRSCYREGWRQIIPKWNEIVLGWVARLRLGQHNSAQNSDRNKPFRENLVALFQRQAWDNHEWFIWFKIHFHFTRRPRKFNTCLTKLHSLGYMKNLATPYSCPKVSWVSKSEFFWILITLHLIFRELDKYIFNRFSSWIEISPHFSLIFIIYCDILPHQYMCFSKTKRFSSKREPEISSNISRIWRS